MFSLPTPTDVCRQFFRGIFIGEGHAGNIKIWASIGLLLWSIDNEMPVMHALKELIYE